MNAGVLAALLAMPWSVPTLSAAGGFAATLLFGGDWGLALIVATTLAAGIVARRMLGARAAAAVLAIGAVLSAHRSGVRRGTRIQVEKEKADARSASEKAARARADADRRNADPARLRDNDGFRRDRLL